MATVYPTGTSIFLVADSTIVQPGGKMTILGTFAAGIIVVPVGTTFPAALPMAIYAVFNDGEGTFKTKIRISDSNGKSLTGDVQLADTTKLPGEALQVAVNFNMFPFPAAGTYKVDLILDDHVYSNDISIREGSPPKV